METAEISDTVMELPIGEQVSAWDGDKLKASELLNLVTFTSPTSPSEPPKTKRTETHKEATEVIKDFLLVTLNTLKVRNKS